MQAWGKAILAADADMANGVIPYESIEIGYFLDHYINENQAMADAVTQGCLVLLYCGHFEHEIDVESGPPAGISDVVASGGPDQIVCEGS